MGSWCRGEHKTMNQPKQKVHTSVAEQKKRKKNSRIRKARTTKCAGVLLNEFLSSPIVRDALCHACAYGQSSIESIINDVPKLGLPSMHTMEANMVPSMVMPCVRVKAVTMCFVGEGCVRPGLWIVSAAPLNPNATNVNHTGAQKFAPTIF